uniref:Uncharacterized protein n=1 Tax=Arundo donax TaxID=35708 RepID=A0A0A9FIS3_ARUDO
MSFGDTYDSLFFNLIHYLFNFKYLLHILTQSS